MQSQVVIILIFLITILVVIYTLARRYRIQNRTPKYIPGTYLKQRWFAWTPHSKYGQVVDGESGRNRSLSANTSYNPAGRETGEAAAADTAVDRHASVRSVMTLPPYSHVPRETEEVIGREGERDGLDIVVEFPETADDEERQREEQMESLYQIRVARRQEVAEREARRQARREARARGDYAALEQLRRESRQRAEGTSLTNGANGAASVSAATLLAEHQSRGRDRRVSEVTYASVGHVRHDGTRLRANSDDSERGGLLDSAAAMGGRSRGNSDAPSLGSTLSQVHFRDRSVSSGLSVSTNGSDPENPDPGTATPPSTRRGARDSADSDPATSGTSNSSPQAARFTPEASTGSDDIGEARVLDSVESPLPPDYEHLDWGDAPAYTEAEVRRRESVRLAQAAHRNSVRLSRSSGLSRVPSQAPQLHLSPLPDIQIEVATEPNTPITPSGEFEMERR